MNSPSPILLAGDDLDIDLIAELLTQLPGTAYGQIIIEVSDLSRVQDLREPPGFTTHWLPRRAPGGRTLHVPGELLIQAISAWTAEWIPKDGTREELPQLIWVGGARCPEVTLLCERLHHLHHSLHLHHATHF